MKPYRVAIALDDDDLGIVEQPLPRATAEVNGRTYERPAERLHGEVEHELGPQRARVREHHDEHPERATHTLHVDGADVGPIDLGLLADKRLDAQEDLVLRQWAHASQVAAQRTEAAGVPALAKHVEDPRADEPRVLSERLVDEAAEGRHGLEDDAPRPTWARTRTTEDALDDVGMDAELRDDGPAFPVLGEVEATDLGLGGWHDGHRPTSAARRRSARKSPRPPSRRARARASATTTPTS